MIALMALVALGLSLTMAFAWAVQRRTGNSGWIDAIWSLAVGFGGVAAVLASGASGGRAWLAAGLVALWSLRLGLHIAARASKGGDDPRYAALREEWGADFFQRLFFFLQVQALAALVLVLAVAAAAGNPAPFPSLRDGLAVAVFIIALAGEAIADAQLARFRTENNGRGAVCDTGLWGLSRHPNYFFEWLAWCAYPLLAIDFTGGHPFGWVALGAPAMMYVLLVHISGIPPLEAVMLKSRGEAFRRYQRRVNAFFPGFPARDARANS